MGNTIKFNIKHFQNNLLDWFAINARILPWRQDSSPYKTFLSEIILQQTRVEQGLPYFLKFLNNYPDVETLASASEDQILKDWQGLGYYSRARNLLKAAKQIVADFGGVFPNKIDELLKLKGVGNYTASAIISINYSKPYAVLDGNVFRVLSRILANSTPTNTLEGNKLFQNIANQLLDIENPGKFNEAMMELGAMICTPKNPICHSCPIQDCCKAYKSSTQTDYPVKIKSQPKKFRYLNFIFIQTVKKKFFIKRREGKDIWNGLYEFPLIESENLSNSKLEMFHLKKNEINKDFFLTHQLTHRTLYISIYSGAFKEDLPGFIPISKDEIKDYGFPKPIEKYLEIKFNVTNLSGTGNLFQ